LDDDTNGYIDDYRGWDFINYDNSTQAGELHPQGSGVTHGTGVAGIAAATGNNGKGIAGVNWNTKILPLQALDDDSYGNSLSVARAITYAAAQGADVISLSLGSDLPDEYVRQAVQAATAAGSVVVAASGNDGCNCMMYPANYPEVVAVGALAPNNAPAGFSSWGTNLDILAPGSDLDVPTWSANNKTQAYALNVSGTSFAAPIVSGMLARLAGQQPAATPLQLIAALTEQTNRLTIPASAPQTHTLGYGKLDGYSAAARMAAAKNSVQTYAFSPASKGDFSAFTQSEVTGSGAVQACEAGKLGTTQLYEIYKGNTTFFTISKAEMAKAQAAGYTVNSFAHICLQQPHDTSGSIRSINLFKEFRNLDKVTQ
jgi:subtilisin family serine protease